MNYQAAFDRNRGLVGDEEQRRLRASTVAVAGAGGVGGYQLMALARLGVGRFRLADPEAFGGTDRNRQCGANVHTVGRPKAQVLAELVRGINPLAEVDVFSEGVTAGNAEEFTRADLVIDAIEYFAFEEKIALFRSARRRGVHVITSPAPGFGATMFVFAPDGPTFESFCGWDTGARGEELVARYFAALMPDPPDYARGVYAAALAEKTAFPVVAPSCLLSGALVAHEALRLLTGRGPSAVAPKGWHVDLETQSFRLV